MISTLTVSWTRRRVTVTWRCSGLVVPVREVRLVPCDRAAHDGVRLCFRGLAQSEPVRHRLAHRLVDLLLQRRLGGQVVEWQNRHRVDAGGKTTPGEPVTTHESEKAKTRREPPCRA